MSRWCGDQHALETLLYNEVRRTVSDRNQVLAVGDARTTPRCWYSMLPDVDPARQRSAAVVVPLED